MVCVLLLPAESDDVVDPAKVKERDALQKQLLEKSEEIRQLRENIPKRVANDLKKELPRIHPKPPKQKKPSQATEKEKKQLLGTFVETSGSLSRIATTLHDLDTTMPPLTEKVDRVRSHS